MENDVIEFKFKSIDEAEQLGFISIKFAASITTMSHSKITRLCRTNYGNPEKNIAKILNDKGLYSYYIKKIFFEKEFKDYLIKNKEGQGTDTINTAHTIVAENIVMGNNQKDHEETHASAIVKRAYKDELVIVRKEHEKEINTFKKEHKSLFRMTVISLIVFFFIILSIITALFIYHNTQMNETFEKNSKELLRTNSKTITDKQSTINLLNTQIEQYKLKENDYVTKLSELNRIAGKNEATIIYNEKLFNNYKKEIVTLQNKIEKLQNSDTDSSFF
jgi:hypothetical protein